MLLFISGHYLYFHAHYYYSTANLQTPTINFASGGVSVCVRFWYVIHGKDTFNVYNTSGNGTLKTPLWSRPGNVPHGWNYAQVHVPRSPPFKVIISCTGLPHLLQTHQNSYIFKNLSQNRTISYKTIIFHTKPYNILQNYYFSYKTLQYPTKLLFLPLPPPFSYVLSYTSSSFCASCFDSLSGK